MKIFIKILFVISLLVISHYVGAMTWEISNFQNKSYAVSFFPDGTSKEVFWVINLRCTDYLSDDDMLVIGDIQDVFEKLESLVKI